MKDIPDCQHEAEIAVKGMVARDRQTSREVLQNLSWMPAGKSLSQPEPIKPTPLPRGPWQDLAVDLLGPLPSGDSVLVVVDYFSRFYEIGVMQSTTSEKIIERLEEIFTTHGLPLSVTSDNGPQFRSDVLERYLKGRGVEHHDL